MKRPLSITILAWLILLFSLIHIIIAINYFIHAPDLASAHSSLVNRSILIDLVVNILFFITAIGFFKGRDNARWLFVVVQVLYWGYSIVIGGMQSVLWISIIICLAMLVIIFLPNANQFFKKHLEKEKDDE